VKEKANIAFIALLTGAAAIAFAPIFVRLSSLGPVATAFWRLTFALPVLWAWHFWTISKNENKKSLSLKDKRNLILAGLFFASDLSVWHWSIHFTSVANATLLANFAPFFVTLAIWIFFKKKPSWLFLTGLMLAIGGTIVLVSSSLNMDKQHLRGDGLGLITAVFYAGYLLTVKHLRFSFPTATIMAWAGSASSAVLFLITLLSGEQFFTGGWHAWIVLVGLALISHVFGQGMITFALAHLPASFSSVSLLLQPVLAALLAWMLFQEKIGLLQGAGGLFVLAGISLARKASLEK